ncbi:hypothetical protein BHE74_00052001 [Ensete ventricosum]|nr:hypothetical protein BHE74_00052001 [Ensete ventricosum]
MSIGEPEASSSGASSGPPSPIDTRVLRDLEVMKAGHDLDKVVTEGSLAAIREQDSILIEYRLYVPQLGQLPYSSDVSGVNLCGMPKVLGGKTPAARSAASTQGVSEAPLTEAPRSSSKRSSNTSVPSDDPSRRHKKVKILSRRHKSCHREGGSRSHSKGKEPAASVEEPEGQAESLEEAGTPVFIRPRSMKDLCETKVHKDDINNLLQETENLKAGGGPEAMAVAEEWVAELEKDLEKMQQEHTEALQRLETSNNELNKVRGDLSEARKQLKEARVRAWKANDDLLKSVKDLESTRAELPKRAVDDYKESVGFKEGLKRMGRVAYEYGYRVTLARFRSLHPDSEVEKDPFTVRPEDDSVTIKRQQAFDDSDPPES